MEVIGLVIATAVVFYLIGFIHNEVMRKKQENRNKTPFKEGIYG